MIGNNPERNKVIWRLMCQNARKERIVLWIGVISLIYAVASNLLKQYSLLPFSNNVLYTLSSIDETLRNCCYGIVAGITFYLLNDFYKNAYQKVDIYNDMYPNLYRLWLKTYQLILATNDHELDQSQSNDELHSSIITNLCIQQNQEDEHEHTTRKMTQEILASNYHLLFVMWSDIFKDKEKYLKIYGHIITREEYSKLDDKELDIMGERLSDYVPSDEQIRNGMSITIRDYDIQRAIYLILTFKTDLALMVNKYAINYYDGQRGIRKDAF